ncbi:MAG: LPXTG cell wall anchor domain-containing protein [Solirubrobacteraceae bacterium]
MRTPLCIVAALVTLAVGVPGTALAQMPDLPDDTPGVSKQPPAPLDGDGDAQPAPETPEAEPGTPEPGSGRTEAEQRTADDELANTGSETIVLLLAGAMVTLLGVALRLRTADAEPY